MFKTKVLSLEGRNPPWIKRQVLAAQGPKHHFPPGQFCNLGIFGDLLNNTKKNMENPNKHMRHGYDIIHFDLN